VIRFLRIRGRIPVRMRKAKVMLTEGFLAGMSQNRQWPWRVPFATWHMHNKSFKTSKIRFHP